MVTIKKIYDAIQIVTTLDCRGGKTIANVDVANITYNNGLVTAFDIASCSVVEENGETYDACSYLNSATYEAMLIDILNQIPE